MKILIRLALGVALLATTATAHADWVSGHYRANGAYVNGYNRSGE